MHIAAFILALLIGPPAMAAPDRPAAGLMWNSSGLPATLPLQIRSESGRDHVIFLIAPASGEPLMAGYVRGGEFFRLLVPPGDWRIAIASGTEWQGSDALFGPETQFLEHSESLHFSAGQATLHGHVLTIAETGATEAASRTICRLPYWHEELSEHPDLRDRIHPDRSAYLPGIGPLDQPEGRIRLRSVLCD